MRRPSKLAALAVFGGLTLVGCSDRNGTTGPEDIPEVTTYVPQQHTADDPLVRDLIANGGSTETAFDVGDVLIWNDDTYLYVEYTLTEAAWCLTQTHLHVAATVDDIPQRKGNPIPGQFDYAGVHDCVAAVGYMIPLDWDVGTELYIAAHSVVYTDPLASFAAELPDQVTMSVQYPYGGGPAYFPTTTISGGTVLDGTYEGWCVDTDHTIANNTDYTANVYSSYEDLTGLVEYPENLDLVNWIINQGFVGQASSACGGTYTYGDVQRSIWQLVEDNQSTSGLGSWSECRVNEILAAAQANGEGFVPDCTDFVAVILQPIGGQQVIAIAQVTLASVALTCVEYDETAWGDGSAFSGKNWATYFGYTVQ